MKLHSSLESAMAEALQGSCDQSASQSQHNGAAQQQEVQPGAAREDGKQGGRAEWLAQMARLASLAKECEVSRSGEVWVRGHKVIGVAG